MASFTSPIPDDWAGDQQKSEFMRDLILWLNDMNREGGIIAVGEATAETTAEQAITLEEQQAALVVVAAQTDTNTTNLAVVQSSSPAYTISNDGTDRAFDADAAAGAITNPPTQAEVENIRDAALELADVVATMNRDLQDKDVFG